MRSRRLYPPLLADQGLVAALEGPVRKSHLGVEVDADGLGRFPADIERTVYFCTLEALQNIAKYAAADGTVMPSAGERGLPSRSRTTGWASMSRGQVRAPRMADRLAAVGSSRTSARRPVVGPSWRVRCRSKAG